MNTEEMTITMPLAEYDELIKKQNELKKQLEKIKWGNCYIKETSTTIGHRYFYEIEVMNYEKLESAAIEQLTKEIEKLKLIKTPTLWQIIKRMLSLS